MFDAIDWAASSSSSTDRIDQIAAVAAATCTDRSTSRWKQKTNEPTGRGSVSKPTFNLQLKPYDLTTTYTLARHP
jgi:hypothetical protein